MKKKNFFLFWIIYFSIGPSFWSERSNIPLFLLILTVLSYFSWLYSIWNKRRTKAFHDPPGDPKKKKESSSLNLLYFYSFFELQPKWIRRRVTSIILLSCIFRLSLFHLIKFHARSLFKKVRPNPTNKTRINYESWFFKECFLSFLYTRLSTILFSIY